MFKSLLVANRGEIAVRIIRAARELGIRTIAVWSEADADALWTRLADDAYCIGPAPARDSYLAIENILEAVRASGAEAVHPGYGLLSESAEFARAVRDAGVTFVGPDTDAIVLMGDKVTARHAAERCGVPVLPGTNAPVLNDHACIEQAEAIGWPIAVKASFGGGGRGMRIANNKDELAAALDQASREAEAAFGRAEVFLEKYLVRPRHIEVQILGDSFGNVIHLGDRDCSVQRRHQKLLEEAPAPNLAASLRERILEAAVRLSRSIGYQSAGTVEFLADVANDHFYFLEMNTRLQVEHGVTELITGVDIAQQQIRIAAGERLGLSQDEVRFNGAAIQARILSENPWQGFRPTPGRIDRLVLPLGPWVRHDFGIAAGDSISQYYDSMFGKIQAWGADRAQARRRLGLALDETIVGGVPTTIPYLRTLLDQPAFADATHDTGSVERDWAPDPATEPPAIATPEEAGIAPPPPAGRSVFVPWGGVSTEVVVHGQPRAGGEPLPVRATVGTPRPGVTRQVGNRDPLLVAPMDSVVVSVAVKPGDAIARGAPILILEAMKMEVVIGAPFDGIVEEILVRAAETVRAGAKLAIVGVK
ncbi:MAG: hypothetical protein EOP60_13710 [Sphingomonadales bacterium]|nr:MAG: hypothetical protein EOP60_13710 [Sphingomonadales bacterium]